MSEPARKRAKAEVDPLESFMNDIDGSVFPMPIAWPYE